MHKKYEAEVSVRICSNVSIKVNKYIPVSIVAEFQKRKGTQVKRYIRLAAIAFWQCLGAALKKFQI